MSYCAWASPPEIGFYSDSTPAEVTGEFRPGSHVKISLPTLPYLAISHAVNGSMIRPANNDIGWQYDLAVSHRSIDDRIWEFRLREGVTFHDGTPFDADAVLQNMSHFKRAPFTFTKLADVYSHVEKVDKYTVRFHLTEPYGVFLQDAMWLQFYTQDYLDKFGWNGKPTCPNLAAPGLYGLGPYILVEGYVEGDRSSSKVVLNANKNYWGDNKPKVETITLYNGLSSDSARKSVAFAEGEVDLTPITFADRVDTALSPHAKLAISPSQNNYAMHFNMINGDQSLLDDRIRYAINHAIDQEYLLNLAMLGEGSLSPTTVSPHFYKVTEAIESLEGFFQQHAKQHDYSIDHLRQLVMDHQKAQGMNPNKPLTLTLVTQESFLFLVREIRFFLERINIDIRFKIFDNESQVFNQLLPTWKGENDQDWDLLLWGNYDWYKHPWTAFFVYHPNTPWSTVPENDKLLELTDKITTVNTTSAQYQPLVAEIIRHVYSSNYMVFLPTPHNVYAVNKEVVFRPGRSAFVYLRDLEVTGLHWSVRGKKPYHADRLRPVHIYRGGGP